MPKLVSNLVFPDNTVQSTAAVGGGATTIYIGSGAPAAGTGADGALYLDYTNLRFWGPKAAGAWPAQPFGRLEKLTPTYGDIKSG